MAMYYSASLNGFFSDGIHGARQLMVDDPTWTRPTLPVFEAQPIYGEVDETTVVVGFQDVEVGRKEDFSVSPPQIEVDNQNCGLPSDAMLVTDDVWQAMMDGQTAGQIIVPGPDGQPTLADRPQRAETEVTA